MENKNDSQVSYKKNSNTPFQQFFLSIPIMIFWSKPLSSVREQVLHQFYKQGRFDAEMEIYEGVMKNAE